MFSASGSGTIIADEYKADWLRVGAALHDVDVDGEAARVHPLPPARVLEQSQLSARDRLHRGHLAEVEEETPVGLMSQARPPSTCKTPKKSLYLIQLVEVTTSQPLWIIAEIIYKVKHKIWYNLWWTLLYEFEKVKSFIQSMYTITPWRVFNMDTNRCMPCSVS